MEKKHLHNITPSIGTEVTPNLCSPISLNAGCSICISPSNETNIDISSFGN